MAEMKNIAFWEELLKNTPDSYREWFMQEKNYLRNIINKNSKVLDIGCGNGRTLNDISDITQNIFGIDNENKSVEDAKKNLKLITNAQILLANARNLPFENNFFDFVLCMGTFANFGNYKFKILTEMKRVLKNDGFIILSVFSENAFDERMKVYKNLNAPIKKVNGTTVFFDFEPEGENISEQFSQKDLELIVMKSDLKILDIKKVGIAYLCKLGKK
ncbi:class I SAM-dependent methyltransferase [Candidatus Woesearchaeota archaeon]|nr:class I SAM-dependent methyltransferase [Candidatus Woesearchaeota archaeon]